MNDRELHSSLDVYRKVVEFVDSGATAEELKWWAAAQTRNLERMHDGLTALEVQARKLLP